MQGNFEQYLIRNIKLCVICLIMKTQVLTEPKGGIYKQKKCAEYTLTHSLSVWEQFFNYKYLKNFKIELREPWCSTGLSSCSASLNCCLLTPAGTEPGGHLIGVFFNVNICFHQSNPEKIIYPTGHLHDVCNVFSPLPWNTVYGRITCILLKALVGERL